MIAHDYRLSVSYHIKKIDWKIFQRNSNTIYSNCSISLDILPRLKHFTISAFPAQRTNI